MNPEVRGGFLAACHLVKLCLLGADVTVPPRCETDRVSWRCSNVVWAVTLSVGLNFWQWIATTILIEKEKKGLRGEVLCFTVPSVQLENIESFAVLRTSAYESKWEVLFALTATVWYFDSWISWCLGKDLHLSFLQSALGYEKQLVCRVEKLCSLFEQGETKEQNLIFRSHAKIHGGKSDRR